MKILITGSNGQLGNELHIVSSRYAHHTFLFTDIQELDITDRNAVHAYFLAEKPEVIINCAAYTAVDTAEREPGPAYLVNETAVTNLAQLSREFNAIMIHISTDYIFDGRGFRPYTEDDPTNPVSVYAKSKLAGEEAMRKLAGRGVIFRTSWLYSEFGGNFLKTILKHAREKEMLNVVYDQVGSPTYAYDLANVILQLLPVLITTNHVAVYHYSNEGVASWYDFARAIIEIAGITCKINPIETKDYPLPASRPFYSVLNKAKFKADFTMEIPFWRDSLKVCIHQLIKQ